MWTCRAWCSFVLRFLFFLASIFACLPDRPSSVKVGLHYGPFGVLCMVYAGTALLTNIISNTATCVMMIPVASHVSHQLQATDCPCPFNEKTLLILVILASNSAFATPLGSPCNILVVDAGDYSFSDFLRFGGVLQLMMMVATCCLLYAYPCA